ncbi:hypothetical protein DMB65_09740 [Flavobacterium cheongpyeongense]|uniref:Uncharacterized protein n=1 Tax=Flavobacterium cheongpyeongense TaxID=2212651 RepID=A0A2V4C3S8_9FLAO|nr:hypothetical protein DMB65_09740 [Flavobacterium cheongpyeongense]
MLLIQKVFISIKIIMTFISLIAEFNFYFVPKKDLFVPIYSIKVILLIFFVQQLIAFTPDQFDLFLRKKKIIRELRYFKIA